MRKGLFLIMSCAMSILCISAFAQSYKYDYHPAYGPAPLGGSPKSIAKQLSYDNFRSIKLLNTAVMNYGGGEAEIDRLIDQYAEASALYFQNKMMESAKAFKENQAAIMTVTKKLAEKYHQDTSAILKDSMNMSIRAKIKMQIKGNSEGRFHMDKFLERGQAGVLKANDYYDRYKDAKSVSAMDLITAIYYYRGAKDSLFQMMKVMAVEQSRVQAEAEASTMVARKEIRRSEKEAVMRQKEEQKTKELQSRYLDKYTKDMTDNKNIVYESREKEK
ncbi:MAG: hypothetical protein JXA07_06290 [Spirochaetes bacterium]|nr:hypothetical protein [Spirochaetota bacterium]